MRKYANQQIYSILKILPYAMLFCVETDHRAKLSVLYTGEMKLWYNHAELSVLSHNPHVLTSSSHPAFCFPKIRGGHQ